MPDDLYDRDIVIWSERQADALRRVAASSRANDVDWEHVIEEVEDLGRSEVNAAHSLADQIVVHLLKLRYWPDSPARNHWRAELVGFQTALARRYAPSMRQRIDIEDSLRRAVRQLEHARDDDPTSIAPPASCPFGVEALVADDPSDLEAAFAAA